VLATTHYSGLKMYAANEDAVLNASVEFDEKSLQPTYRLLVGVAGSSSGIEIARRFGFSEEIIERARRGVSESARDAASYLQRIKRESEEAENLRRALEEEREAVAEKYAAIDMEAARRERERQASFERELLETIEDFEKRSREFASKIEDRVERARTEREAQRRAAELKREAARTARAPAAIAEPQASRGVRVVRDGHVVDARARAEAEPKAARIPSRPIEKGDSVRLKSFGSIGIVDKLSGDEAEVRVKSLRFREKLENLELVEAEPVQPTTTSRGSRLKVSRSTEVHLRAPEDDPKTEINLIGRTTDEAVDAADKFLDEAYMHSMSRIRIIHGHGTGALRRAIADFLRNHPHVERFAQAPPDQGGAGATVVELKQ
jgi:DNA mismatch repair protein MutS2